MYWLGIDVGTGGTRALLVDASGIVRFGSTVDHEPMRMEHPLWAEQRPEDWWAAARKAIGGVLKESGATAKDIAGVGLSGQMHGLTLLDDASHVVRPALIWCDQRSQAQVEYIERTIGKAAILAAIANPMLTGFTLPKLLWVRDHDPGSYKRIRHLLLPKDYIRYQLTGEYATDVADASGTGLFDVVNRRWALAVAAQLNIDETILPRAYESHEVTGVVSAMAAAITGLAAGTPVVAGAGDQAASAVGSGVVEPGLVSCTIGTSGVVFAHLTEPAYDPRGAVHTFCHAVAGAWHAMGVTQGAGLSLQWFRNQLAPGVPYDELTAQAANSPAGSQGLFWLPYLMGERTPHLDPKARGGWIGLTASHTRADLIRALIEGVSYSQKDGLELIEKLGAKVASVRVSGGGAQSAFWRQMLANVFNKRVVTLATTEGSAYGAALLAMVGTAAYSSVTEACRAVVREVETMEPQPEIAAAYAEGYEVYRSLYPALRPIFPSMR